MKKLNIIILISLIMIQIVSATQLCEDTIPKNTLCTLLTPTLNYCQTYNYTIYDENGGIITQNNLTLYNSNISVYKLNFTQNEGTYLISICDGSTREIYVEGNTLGGINEVKGSMAWIAVSLLMICMTGFMGWGANMIRDEGLKHVKKALFYLFISNTFMLGIIGFIVSVNAFDPSSFDTLGLAYASINIFLILGFSFNYFFLMFARIYKKSKNRWVDVFTKNNGGGRP